MNNKNNLETSTHNPKKRKNTSRPDRFEYLKLLVCEFKEVRSEDAKKQVLANLANFAYDPFNYNYFRQLGVLDLFLNNLQTTDETLIQFSIGGLCNLSPDPENIDYIVKSNGIGIIEKLLEINNEDILISAVTTLMFIFTSESNKAVTDTTIKNILKLTTRKNNRLKNIAQIFIDECCSEQEVKSALDSLQNSVEDIPLPDQ